MKDLPVVRLFRRGHMVPYDQSHQAQELTRWISKQSGPAVALVKTTAQLDAAVQEAVPPPLQPALTPLPP